MNTSYLTKWKLFVTLSGVMLSKTHTDPSQKIVIWFWFWEGSIDGTRIPPELLLDKFLRHEFDFLFVPIHPKTALNFVIPKPVVMLSLDVVLLLRFLFHFYLLHLIHQIRQIYSVERLRFFFQPFFFPLSGCSLFCPVCYCGVLSPGLYFLTLSNPDGSWGTPIPEPGLCLEQRPVY